MTGKTHQAAGVALALTVSTVTGGLATTPLWTYAWAGITALLPDLDQAQSTAGHIIFFKPFHWYYKHFAHRGMTHSLTVGVPLFGLLSGVIFLLINRYTPLDLPVVAWYMGMLGYTSHILADMFNKQGCALFWPFGKSWKGGFWANGFISIPLFKQFRIRTGGGHIRKDPSWPERLYFSVVHANFEKWAFYVPCLVLIFFTAGRNLPMVVQELQGEWFGLLGGLPAPLALVLHTLWW